MSKADGSRGMAAQYAAQVAATPDDHLAASDLIRRMYQWRGYSIDSAHAPHHGVTFVASESGRIAASVTVRLDSGEGLAVQEIYPDEVASLRREGARLCEFTRLAADRTTNSTELFGALFHVAYLYARRAHRATHLLAEVNPRHVRYYVRMLGFLEAGPQRICGRVGAPAVLIVLPLEHAERQIARYGGQRVRARVENSLYPYFFSPEEEARILARLLDAPQRSSGRYSG